MNMLMIWHREAEQIQLGFQFSDSVDKLAFEPWLLVVQVKESAAQVCAIAQERSVLARNLRLAQKVGIEVVVGPRLEILPKKDRAGIVFQFGQLRKHRCIRNGRRGNIVRA